MSIMSDWLRDQEELETYGNDLMYKVNVRNQHPSKSVQFSRMGSQVNIMLRTMKERISALKDQLNVDVMRETVTLQEAERRQKLLDSLSTKCKQIEHNISNPDGYAREALLGGSGLNQAPGSSRQVKVTEPTSGVGDEREDSPDFNPNEYRKFHKQLEREQNQGLDVLADIITRQQGLARGIGNEIDVQNEIIDDIDEGMENTNQRLLRNTRNIKKITFKSDTCCYWVVIVLLLIAIIVVASL